MRRRRLVAAGLTALFAASLFAIAGCGDSITMSGPASVDDEGLLREFLEEDEIFDDLGPYDGTQGTVDGGDGRDAIDPLTFWREITERDRYREIIFDPEEGTAQVTVHRDVWGILHIVDQEMDEYEKPFHHEGLRLATFARDPDWEPPHGPQGPHGPHPPNDGSPNHPHPRPHGPWSVIEVSGFLAQSEECTISIDWIRVQSASVDVTITDPLALLAVPDEIMAFERDEEVTVTVSGPPEDSIVFLHTRRHRSPLEYAGDGTFTGTWTVTHQGRHTAWVQALAHDTIFDSEYPDDALIWGAPYFVFDEEFEE